MTTIIFLLILLSLTFAKLLIQGIYLIHKIQQMGYSNLKLIKWLEGNQYRSILVWNIFELLVPLLIIISLYFYINEIPIYKYITATIMLMVFSWKLAHPFISNWIGKKANIKVPLKYTSRVKRLIASFIIITIITLTFSFIYTATPIDNFTLSTLMFFKFNAFLLFISVITPVILLFANLVNVPVEKLVHYKYFRQAKRKLQKTSLIKIAITGSYGKTSTKHFLASILSAKHKTLFTPGSYNTPMGISKVINQNDLKQYEIFIAEMGADQKGDINTLCKLVEPDFGILTAIDIQHLETFGTLQNIIDTKISLFQNLKGKAYGIYNFDSDILRDNIKYLNFSVPLYSYSIKNENRDLVDIIAQDIKHTRSGLEFNAVFQNDETIQVKTGILGSHNILNLLAAILFAKLFGLTNSQISNGLQKIQPVEHRLQRIDSPNGILILDDAFNANLKGAIEALKVLHEIEGNNKIIITPGLIGLGNKEKESNKELGKYIADYADLVILIGKERTKSIYEGIMENNFKKENIFIASSLHESKSILAKIITRGDVVLFENDLPDTFNE